MEHRYELTDTEWERIRNMFSPEHPKEGKRGRPAKYDNRRVIDGILWIARNGAPWRELSEQYGKWQAVYARFCLRKQLGIFEIIFAALSADVDMENLSIDSTSCKVHQSANGGEKSENKAIGASKGGRNTKIHAVVDGLGNPVTFLLSGGNDHNSKYAIPLLSQIAIRDSDILGDKAYNAKAIRDFIIAQDASYTIQPKRNDLNP